MHFPHDYIHEHIQGGVLEVPTCYTANWICTKVVYELPNNMSVLNGTISACSSSTSQIVLSF
jgi:hypothetical protein